MKDDFFEDDDDPVSVWLGQLKQGEQTAAHQIWNHFVRRLCSVARQKLQPTTRRVYDEEDAAQSAFNSLCAGIEAGRFPDLSDRQSLWNLLVVITSRKIAFRHRYDQRDKRNVNRTVNECIFANSNLSKDGVVQMLESKEPSPEFSAEFGETCKHLFEMLDDPVLQEVGRLKIEGFGDEEIALELDCSRRTIQRKVERIRRIWSAVEFM